MITRHEVQVLLEAGHSCAKVAEMTGLSRATIYRIRSEKAVDHTDDRAERQTRRIGRRSKAEPYRVQIEQWIKEDPQMLSVEVLRLARAAGYSGAKTAIYELAASLRPPVVRQMVRFEGLAGEFTQHDFGQVDVTYLDGRRERVHFFASRLKYSRWAEVSLVPDEKAESLVRSLLDHFVAFGGIPLLAVFDRPKTVALNWAKDGRVLEWNPTFAAFALELGLGIELCWPHSPQQKGSVENLVGWVKGSFFKQRRFVDHADLDHQRAQWLYETNTQRPNRATNEIPAQRLERDRARLRPLRLTPDELALRFPTRVGPTATVVHDNHHYSMPPDALGQPATLWLYRDRVRIVAGRFEAIHPRLFVSGAKSILPEHRAQAIAAVSGKRAKHYAQREHLIGLGQPALDYIEELVQRRPNRWYRDIVLLHQLLQEFGDKAMLSAFQWGCAKGAIGAEYIAHYLTHTQPIPNQGAFL